MKILGVDPGETTGWCVYDGLAGRVTASGMFEKFYLPHVNATPDFWKQEQVAIERPVAHGPTRPQVVECARIEGRIVQSLELRYGSARVYEITRREVKSCLTAATNKDVVVTDDATAWAALKLLHGEGCDKKGGALYGVKSHGRAALAVAYALYLMK